jgi:hypothetical protein
MIALAGDYGSSRQWLAAELHDSRIGNAVLGVQRRSYSDQQIKPEH